MRPELLLAGVAGAVALLVAGRAQASMARTALAAPRVSSGPWSPPAAASPYLQAIAEASLEYGLPDGLLARVIYEESRYRADIISGATVSSAGAIGIAQFEPPTAADYGVDPYDPESSIEGAAHYLADLYARFGSWSAALIAYNWGPGNLARKGIGAAPPGARAYAANILADVPGVA